MQTGDSLLQVSTRATPLLDRMLNESCKNAFKQWRRSPKPIIHLHLHNSAGSTFCSIGNIAGERVNLGYDNCNLRWNKSHFYDGPFGNISESPSCQTRLLQMSKENVSMSMIERYMNFAEGDWCPTLFHYSVILRNPTDRAMTTLRINGRNDSQKAMQLLTTVGNRTVSKDWLHSHATYNDFTVRSLNGPEVMALPVGAVTREHLETAKDRLKLFDVVIDLDNAGTDRIQLTDKFGWPYHWLGAAFKYNPRGNKVANVPPDLAELLRVNNRLDMELYEFGRELAANRSRAAMDRLGQGDSLSGLPSACLHV